VNASGRTFYLTTPIYYVNARPHLGHAYTMIAADTMARWHRLAGDDVWFLTGTDEHGDKIAQEAARAGVSPQAYADEISAAFREMWKHLGLSHDDFIRTTEPRHTTIVQAILQRLWEAGELYLGKYGGHYCFGCERFYTEKEIVDGQCPDHQTPLTWIDEENYFFRMSKYQGWLIDYIERHPGFIRPERYRNEILGFLSDPLQDLSISRPKKRLQWGIPLPFDANYVTYVWFDALINYVSALGGPGDPRFARYWPHAQHLIGKDILKPHAVYWPCMLKAAGIDVYRHLNVHGYWTVEGRKMSKSLGNVVEPPAFTAKHGNDAFRYFVMREMVFGLDADFSQAALVGRLNADLANDLGNLVARATTLIASFAGERIPVPVEETRVAIQALGARDLRASWDVARGLVEAAMEQFGFHRALEAIWAFIGHVNHYIDVTQPWALNKTAAARPRLDTVLYDLGQSLWCLGVLLEPFVPEAAAKIRGAVGQPAPAGLTGGVWGGLRPGTTVHKLSGLFPRVEDKAARGPNADAPSAAVAGDGGAAGRLDRDEFARVDLRVAEVLAAEPVAKSRKLLKLTVSLGGEQRTVVAGIAEHYAPADLVGKKVVIVANLEPAKLMGIESRGMLLAGTVGDRLAVLTLDRDLPPGAKVT
jgi:methionyl-tRNA synthetase